MVAMSDKPRVRVRAGRMQSGSRAYEASRFDNQELASWNPTLSAVNDEVNNSRDRIVSRARDLVRNNGWAAGAIDKRVDAVIGADLWLSLKPNWRALGITAEASAQWASEVEIWFKMWAEDPDFRADVERNQTWGGLMRLGYYHYCMENEALAVVYFLPRAGNRFGTCIKVIDPDRLSNPNNTSDTPEVRGGVEVDRNGAATAYYINAAHPNDYVVKPGDQQRWVRVPRWTRAGRPNVVHAFRKDRAGQLRGVSRLAAVLKRFKMLDRYDDSELQAAALNAIMSLFITTNSPGSMPDALAPVDDSGMGDEYDAAFDRRAAFHEKSNLTFNGVRIPLLADGEKIETVKAERPSNNFAAFEAAVLRSVSSAFGLTYEQISNDWGNVNYSSARAALIEIWRGMIADRLLFCRQFVTPLFTAWLEEAILRGIVKLPAGAPGFYEMKAAYTACQWIGPGRGWVDPVKEAEAAGMRMKAGLSTLEDEAAEQGKDWRDNLDMRARIRVETMAAGLPDPELQEMAKAAPAAPTAPDPRGGGQQKEAA